MGGAALARRPATPAPELGPQRFVRIARTGSHCARKSIFIWTFAQTIEPECAFSQSIAKIWKVCTHEPSSCRICGGGDFGLQMRERCVEGAPSNVWANRAARFGRTAKRAIGARSCVISFEQGLIVFAVAAVVTYIMVPVSKRIAHALGAIDYPSNRRVNTDPIPRCGGIALYCGFLAGCFTVYIGHVFFGWGANDYFVMQDINYRLLFVGMTFMFCVGLVDDIVQLSAPVKLAGQIVASLIVVASGVSVEAVRLLGSNYLELTWLDVPITVLYLVVFANVINLIDGLDGLAAGIVAIAAVGLFILTANRGSTFLALACLALIAACVAFLRFNFHPASVFMGDSGALLLGLILGVVSVTGVVRTQSFVVMLVPFVIAGVPVLDTLSSIVRRRHEHHPVGEADLEHIHHRLVRFGMSQRTAVLVLYGCSALLVGCACFLIGMPVRVQALVFVVLFVGGMVAVWFLGLAHPVLRHHYEGKGKRGPRVPHVKAAGSASDFSKVEPSASVQAGSADADAPARAARAGKSKGGGE